MRRESERSIVMDPRNCIGCVACSQACPTRAIRVRHSLAAVDHELCIDCGACIRACRHDAVHPITSSPADLKKFRHTVAIPSVTLFAQFGRETMPGQVMAALRAVGFDSTFDLTWMCEAVGHATDAYLSECPGPWPKISVTCPAVVRLIQIRYPDLIPHLLPLETPRELAAKLARRRRAAELKLVPEEIGVFFITPCTAIMNSIVDPVGLKASYLDGAFSIAALYGDLFKALREAPPAEGQELASSQGLLWAMSGGETGGLRNANTLNIRGVRDVTYAFDHIEAGKFQSVDFIEAYICPDGCVSGGLTVEGRYAAQRNIQAIVRRLGRRDAVREEEARALLARHFFDFEEDIRARREAPRTLDLRQAVARSRDKSALIARLPRKDCGACGAPDCATLAEDILQGKAVLEDCVFLKIESLQEKLGRPPGGQRSRE